MTFADKNKLVLLLGVVLLSSACSDSLYPKFKKIHTGIYLDGKEIIVADRNLGAKNPGDNGGYYTWEEAKILCPMGYHVMTIREITALYAEEEFDSGDKLIEGRLKMPAAGYFSVVNDTVMDNGVWGDYHIDEEYDEDLSWYLQFESDGMSQELDFMPKTDKLSVRFVKGKPKKKQLPYKNEIIVLPVIPKGE